MDFQATLRQYSEALAPKLAQLREFANRVADQFVDEERPSDTRQRVYSGLAAGGGFILFLYLIPGIWFLSFATLFITLLGVMEYNRLVKLNQGDMYFGPGASLAIVGILWLAATRPGGASYFGWVLWFGMALLNLVAFLYARSSNVVGRVSLYLLGIVWVALPMMLLLNTYVGYTSGSGYRWFAPSLILYFVGMMWLNDSAAYFVGRKYGKTKLAPRLSPKKTVEGFAGGVGASIVGAFVLPWLLPQLGYIMQSAGVSSILLIMMGAALGVAGPFGDLVESSLKREAGVKDSGTFLPGHGGVLDRIDSFLFAAPIFVAFCWTAMPVRDLQYILKAY